MKGLTDLASRLRSRRRSSTTARTTVQDRHLTDTEESECTSSQRPSHTSPESMEGACIQQQSPERAAKASSLAKAHQLTDLSRLRRQSGARACRFLVSTQKLGSGAYGSVMMGTDARSGEEVAIKFIADGRMKPASLEREIGILRRLSSAGHPALLRFHAHVVPADARHGDVLSTGHQPMPKALRDCHALVMEPVRGGELFEYVLQRDGLSEEKAAPMFAQLVDAVRCAHQMGIAHRDLKLENVLLRGRAGEPDEEEIVLIDWGLAHQHALDAHCRAVPERLHSRCGSRSYMAPEVTNKEISSHRGYSGFEADVWSLGVCLFAIHLAFFPFEQANPEHDWRARRVASAQRAGESTMATIFGFYPDREHLSNEYSPSLIALLDRMLVFEPSQRASLSEVMASEWLRPWIATADAVDAVDLASAGLATGEGRSFSTYSTSLEDSSSGHRRSLHPDATSSRHGSATSLHGGSLHGSLHRISARQVHDLAPQVERQDSTSTVQSTASSTRSASSVASSIGSSVVASMAHLRDLPPRRLSQMMVEQGKPEMHGGQQTDVGGLPSSREVPSHWAAVRYAIAGAKQQRVQQQARLATSHLKGSVDSPRLKGGGERAFGEYDASRSSHPELRHITALFAKVASTSASVASPLRSARRQRAPSRSSQLAAAAVVAEPVA